MVSLTLEIGRSFIAATTPMNVDQLIDKAAKEAQANPEVAAEITLATVEEILMRFGSQSSLCSLMRGTVDRLCQARDLSLVQ